MGDASKIAPRLGRERSELLPVRVLLVRAHFAGHPSGRVGVAKRRRRRPPPGS